MLSFIVSMYFTILSFLIENQLKKNKLYARQSLNSYPLNVIIYFLLGTLGLTGYFFTCVQVGKFITIYHLEKYHMTLSVYSFEITCGKCCFIKTSYNFTCIEIITECCCNSENNESLPHKQACQMSL